MARPIAGGLPVAVALAVVLATAAAAAIPVHRNDAADWDKDCFILCHYECSMWKGTDITHCAHQCMAKGFDRYRKLFQPKWCFDIEGKSNWKRSQSASSADARDAPAPEDYFKRR